MAVLRRQVHPRAFEIIMAVSNIAATIFSVPPPIADVSGYRDYDGCWIIKGENPFLFRWTCFYGPIFVLSTFNFIFSICIHVASTVGVIF